MVVTKKQREIVYAKFDGKCAYCGFELPMRWHVDHIDPLFRGYGSAITGQPTPYPERHAVENMNPACPTCNISKASYTLEQWRERLEQHVESFNLYSTPYRLAKMHGLIKETGAAIVFYFEKLTQGDHP